MGLLRIIFENLCKDQEGSLDSESLRAVSGGLDGSVGFHRQYFIKDDEMILKQNYQI